MAGMFQANYTTKVNIMTTVYNLSGNEVAEYDNNISPLQAVCTEYCLNNNLASWWFNLVHNKMLNTPAINSLPITKGKHSIACGDYCAKY